MFKKKILALLSILIVVMPISTQAYTFTGNKFQHPTNLRYYIADSVRNNGFWSDANHGAKVWGNSPEIQIYENFSYAYAEIRFAYSNTDKGDIVATEISECRCTTNDYSNITFWQGFKTDLSDTTQKETAAHEVGHSLGLDHEDDVLSIMLTEGFNYNIYPQADDWKGIAARY